MDCAHKVDPWTGSTKVIHRLGPLKVAHGLGFYGWSMDAFISIVQGTCSLQPGKGSMTDQ